MRVAVPDLVSNPYFPVVAAVELGFFRAEGLDAELVANLESPHDLGPLLVRLGRRSKATS